MNKNEIITAIFLAKKNILKNKSSLILTVLIISLGFISSIIIYGVLKDTGYDMQENYIETSIGHIMLEPYDNKVKINDADRIIKKIKTIPNIIGIASISKKNARLYDKNNDFIDTEIHIINPKDFSKTSVIDEIIIQGKWLNSRDKNNIILGCLFVEDCNPITAFDRINVNVGDNIKTIFNNNEVTLRLEGIYSHNFIDIERISYITQDTAEILFEDYNSNSADYIIIRLSDRKYTKQTIEQLTKMNLNLEINDWEEKSSRYSSIIDSFLVIGNISFLIGILISGISIYVILYINILNKKSQIGIIKALGIKSKVISLSYVILSLFIGIIGSILGVLMTLLMIEYFKLIPIKTGIGNLIPRVTPQIFLLVAVAIIISSMLSGYIVAKRITKQNIIEAIFYG
jgi:putative ABC transport system permease protein